MRGQRWKRGTFMKLGPTAWLCKVKGKQNKIDRFSDGSSLKI
jgi:hypothetical protein